MRLTYQTVEKYTSIEVSEDKRSVAVFHGVPGESALGIEKLCEFSIEEVWDMIQNAIVTADVGPIGSPGMFRRKGEAAAGILYTNKFYGMKE